MIFRRITLALALAAHSVHRRAADLLTIYRDSQVSDPVYQSARATYNATLEKVPQARSGYLPLSSPAARPPSATRSTSRSRATSQLQHDRLRDHAFAADLPPSELDPPLDQAKQPGPPGGGDPRGRAAGSRPARVARLFRRAPRAGQRRAVGDAEQRHLRAARTGQAQLRGGNVDHRRHPRRAGALRPDHRPGRRSPTRTTSR